MSTETAPGGPGQSPPGPAREPGFTATHRPSGDAARRLAAAAEQAARRWPLSRITGAAVLVMALFSMLAIAIAGTALAHLASARSQVEDVIDPASQAGRQLAYEQVQFATLGRLTAGSPVAQADLAEVQSRIGTWRSSYALPAIASVKAAGKPVISNDINTGKALFDSLRQPLSALETELSVMRGRAIASLDDAERTLDIVCVAIGAALLLVVGAVAILLRRTTIGPLTRLAVEARQVAAGDFEHEVTPSGPREAADLAVDVNRMRERILSELSAVRLANSALAARALDLERSNSELEQFAYVASHDLQEPLRKVASFCQLLQRRYMGQLDERADQYIEFAVDGAKRMQVLIDDLLAFSRVGRIQREPALISCASALSAARVNLASEIRESGAVIETAELPVVRAEFSLITSLFQNLLSNAIKFRGDKPPHIVISVQRMDA